MNINNTILDEMKECGSQMTEMELRGLLGCFLFSGDDADKKIKVLSGGEKARVALAKVIVSKANFLMLDEPTNHLDMHSCDLLIDSLKKYEGSMILVSHDRYFVSKTANKIWEIVDYEVKEFKGGYDEWVEWKERMAKQEADKKKAENSRESVVKSKESRVESQEPGVKSQKQVENKPQPVAAAPVSSAPINKEQKKELQKVQKQFQQAEEQIAKLKAEQQELEQALASPDIYGDKTKFLQTETAYKAAADKLKTLNSEYEKLFERIMELEG